MSILKKSLTTVAVTGALLSGAFATPAAAADPNTCPQGKICGWTGKNRTGTRTVLSVTPGCEMFTGARSVSNQTQYRIELWHVSGACGRGTLLVTLKPHTYSNDPGGTVTGLGVYGR
ncbi:peptidase inhibitor family I36 protein [Streptomyces cinerochromogenes]|uniref:Peptidase inhibitor family I36 protein n=1 Tax=Streptomyces cinerochromogenes TaxID=66422 RepID=A0ABW7B0A1_9ACTN